MSKVNNNSDKTYSELLQDQRWRELRELVLSRDGKKCRNCKSGSQLQIHHRQYHICSKTQLKIAPWEYDLQLLVTLCETCHENGHQVHQYETYFI